MSRRLWWSLILFDTRIGEMADFQATSLLPMWDCRVPLNVNDSELRLEMKEPPRVQGNSTDALFTVVRSELGDFVRHTMFHLGYYGPSLKPADGDVLRCAGTEGGETDRFEKAIEAKYLNFCNPDDPLQFLTIWTTRGHIAKFRLMEHHSRYAGSPLHQAEPQREAALSYALSMLECNTKLVTSPLTKGSLWMVNSYFPFVGYIQADLLSGGSRFFELLAKFVFQAWEAREAAFKELRTSSETPQIVLSIRQRLISAQQPHDAMDMGSTDSLMSTTMDRDVYNPIPNMGVHDAYAFPGLEPCADLSGPSLQDFPMDYVDWLTMNWDMGNASISGTGSSRAPEQQAQNDPN
ncbi:uncharacterized protein K460DRAFT_376331 [Cucurbitaria berberidis CBS 394.84]|uniref:Transcription factor domain-containing protein n=1 Tax=Cucurbitaria berberidis CBS 394.84 TaxID=1168544 RepID=A0A9P4L7Z3_9PLEO|nr:uncharacterized protein K460DRAFT_376331 [Cucurbitaria berberidis CBS 394.84]KAF1844688.1 hypothetical protein K460DRAFT_376331 [Cucurbitaria berberidis CBS 394.84]